MTVKTCPDRDTLQRLLAGTLFDASAEALETHLLECDRCLAVARDISGADDMSPALRIQREQPADDDVLAAAIERAKQLRSQSETVETDQTMPFPDNAPVEIASGSAAVASDIEREIDFLAPPEQSDEIGRLGGYRVLEVLGVGGMGVVFRAEDPRLKRQVALKAMKPAVAASRSSRDRFVREAQATAAIEHDNIVHIYEVDEDRNIPFIAMQFLRGETLRTRLLRDRRLEPSELLRIGGQVAAGLQAAHERGLIHRDIKPDNIWLEEGTDRVKILDFGLVRSATDDAGLTQTGIVVGTPRYMAPEQAQGDSIDHRCDLFSLGSVLYHMAAGKTPFGGSSLTATLIAVSQADCRPLREICPDLDPELISLITRLLSKNRDERPQSAAEVVGELAALEGNVSVERSRKGQHEKPQRPQSPGSRRPLLYAGGLVAIALAVFAWLYFAGVIFRVEAEHGTLVVKVKGDDFTATAQGEKVTIKNVETGETITIDLDSTQASRSLEPGSYFVLETDSGLKTQTAHFTIRSGRREVVEVSWEPKPRIAADESDASQPWITLFDGSDTSHWKQLGAFRAVDGELVGVKGELAKSRDVYDDFELEFQWRISEGGNGGVFYRERADGLDETNFQGTEYQLLDNQRHNNGKNPLTTAGALFGVIAPNADVTRPVGEFNVSRIVCQGGRVEHWMNGQNLLAYDLDSEAFRQARDKLGKAPLAKQVGAQRSGHIYLQCWTGEVAFRNIRLRRLDSSQQSQPPSAADITSGPAATSVRGDWRIVGDAIESTGEGRMAMVLFGSPEFGDGDFTCEVLKSEGKHGLAIVARASDLENYYYFDIGVFDNKWSSIYAKEARTNWRRVAQRQIPPIPTDRWVKLRLRMRGDVFEGFIDDELVLRGKDDRRLRGRLGLRTWNETGKYRNLKFTDPSGKVLWEGLPELPADGARLDTQVHAFEDGDRRAAEYVLSLSGTVKVDDHPLWTNKLPVEPFRLTGVNLEHKKGVTDAGLALLADCQHLQALNLRWTGTTDGGLFHFRNCKGLKLLELGPGVTDEGLAHFRGCRELTRLYLTGEGIGDEGVANFKDCGDLSVLMLQFTNVSEVGLAHFGHSSNLQTLDLDWTKATPAGLAHFEDCRNLTRLILGPDTTDECLANFKSCKGLTHVDLQGQEVSDAGLAHFKDCRELTTLKLHNTRVTGAGLAQLENCAKLAHITLSSNSLPDAEMALFKNWRQLTHLTLDRTQITDAGLAHLKDCKSLRVFVISQAPHISAGMIQALSKAAPDCEVRWDGDANASQDGANTGSTTPPDEEQAGSTSPDRLAAEWVQSICGHPFTYIVIRQNGVARKVDNEQLATGELPTEPFELTGVHLHYNRELTDDGLAYLKDCRHLTLLHFGYTEIGDAGLAHLKTCAKNLQELHLPGGCTDAGLASFADCRDLTRLSLHGVRASTEGLRNFKHCKKLDFLFLGGSQLEGDSLESFASCPDLEHLDVRNTGLAPAELAHFKDCQKLKHLDVSGNPAISNNEMRYFQNCKELTHLNLAYANVDDEGLAFLTNCRNLEYLNVGKTRVSQEFLDALSRELPNCNIDREPKWPRD
ncbi:MAG: DUF1080 domain-containing protein [Pirellulaceae bacterium]